MPWPGEEKEKIALPVPKIWCLPVGAINTTDCFLAGAGSMEKWVVLWARRGEETSTKNIA